MKQMT